MVPFSFFDVKIKTTSQPTLKWLQYSQAGATSDLKAWWKNIWNMTM